MVSPLISLLHFYYFAIDLRILRHLLFRHWFLYFAIDLRILRPDLILIQTYESLSGLRINRAKSNFVPISVPTQATHVIQRILASPSSQLPMTYLGLPLSIRKPTKAQFQPIILAIHNRIASWKSNLLSYGGRLVLVKSVLSALPLHYAQAFRIPKWVIKHIDQQRRNFLWKGNDRCKPINCLVNWERTCALKQEGGLGIIDIADQNAALLVK